MKSKLSTFLIEKKPILKSIISDLSKEFKYVSILGADTIGTSYNVSRSNTAVSDSRLCERGFVARVFNGVNYSEYSFNKLDDVELVKQEIRKVASGDIKKYQAKGVKLMAFPLIKDDNIVDEFHSEFEIDPDTISAEDKLSKLSEIMKIGLSKNEAFIDFRVGFEEVKLSKIFLSTEKDLSQSILFCVSYLIPIAKTEAGSPSNVDIEIRSAFGGGGTIIDG